MIILVMHNERRKDNMEGLNEAFAMLDSEMMGRTFLSSNPVLEREEMNGETLKKVVASYTALVASIVRFLTKARMRLGAYPEIASELERNVAEELGSKTRGESHQAILTRCLADEKGLRLHNYSWSDGTVAFLASITLAMTSQSEGYVAGVVYALEATATPELGVVGQALDLLPSVGVTPAEKIGLGKFLRLHTELFEPGHRDELAKAVNPYLGQQLDVSEFKEGFKFVLDLMDMWWEHLATIH